MSSLRMFGPEVYSLQRGWIKEASPHAALKESFSGCLQMAHTKLQMILVCTINMSFFTHFIIDPETEEICQGKCVLKGMVILKRIKRGHAFLLLSDFPTL